MKKLLKYIIFIFLLFLLSLVDGSFFKNTPISFWILVCFCLYEKSDKAIVICALFGLVRDAISLSLPYFSLIYLYISVGCVWCAENFLGLDLKKVIIISFFALFSYYLLCFFINAITYAGIFAVNNIIFDILVSAFLSLLSPAIYFSFKRLKF